MLLFQRKNNGKIWKAGKDIWGLCSAYNHASTPDIPLTNYENKRSKQYSKAIMTRIRTLGFVFNIHYKELSDGTLFPLKIK